MAGKVEILGTGTVTTVLLDGDAATVTVGIQSVTGQAGTINVLTSEGDPAFRMDGSLADLHVGAPTQDGDVYVYDTAGTATIHLGAKNARVEIGGKDNEGDIFVRDASGLDVFHVDGNDAQVEIGADGHGGDLILRDGTGGSVFHVEKDGSVTIGRKDKDGGKHGDLRVRDGEGRTVFHVDGAAAELGLGAEGNSSELRLRDGSGLVVFRVEATDAKLTIGRAPASGDSTGKNGDIALLDAAGKTVFKVAGENAFVTVGANGNEGDVSVLNSSGVETIRLDGGSGDIILSNADCAEEFDVAAGTPADPGTVLVIGDDARLSESHRAYDRRVAGVVSGAGPYKPGIVLDRRHGDPQRPAVALVGKVYCKVDAEHGPIAVGDLLVTSPTAGHAMVAADRGQTPGAVIGKALRAWPAGRGLIPILVSLQ